MSRESLSDRAAVRHHPVIVTLHWLIALLIASEAAIGVGILHFWPDTSIKIPPLTLHMVLGISLLVLMTLQIVLRFTLARPAPATTGSPLLDLVAKATHTLLYVFTFLMAGSGILLAVQSHVLQLVVGGRVLFHMVFKLFLHAAIFAAFGLLCTLHVLAALFHQFVLKDRLFARMGYERQAAPGRSIRSW